MNEIFIARKALEACLISSALLALVTIKGGGICCPVRARNYVGTMIVAALDQGSIDFAKTAAQRSVSAPITIRSG